MKIAHKKSALALAGLTTSFALAFSASAAMAQSGSWGDLWVGSDGRLDNSDWRFDNSGNYGGFVVDGYVCDEDADGDGVYGQGRTDGHGYSSKEGDDNGAASGCDWEGREFYSPAVIYVDSGQYQICVNDWGFDTCNESPREYRN